MILSSSNFTNFAYVKLLKFKKSETLVIAVYLIYTGLLKKTKLKQISSPFYMGNFKWKRKLFLIVQILVLQ